MTSRSVIALSWFTKAVADDKERWCSRRKFALLAIVLVFLGYLAGSMQCADELNPAVGVANFKNADEKKPIDCDRASSQDQSSSSHASSYDHLYKPKIEYDRDDMSWISAISRTDDEPKVDCEAMNDNPLISPTCNCSEGPGSCCARQFLHNHKHGVYVADHLMSRYFPSAESGVKRMLDVLDVHYDYRSVVMVRNFYDALVSGYLYHKSGHECWLSPTGQPESRLQGHLREWASKLEQNPPLVRPAKGTKLLPENASNLDLCEYLARAEEEDGVRDYVNFAMINWFPKIYKTYQMRHADCDRTIAICFSEILEPDSDAYKQTVVRMQQHWFPATVGKANAILSKKIRGKPGAKSTTMETVSSHSTTHDVGVRTRLLQLVQQVDYTYWNGTIAAGNEFYGCRGEFENLGA